MAATAGEVTFGSGGSSAKRTICLLAQRSTTNSPPSGATAGHPTYESIADNWHTDPKGAFFMTEAPDSAVVCVSSTAGSGTMTATITLWGYLGESTIGKWFAIKALNGGSPIPETTTDLIRYSEVVTGVGAFDRIYAEVVAIAGSSTAVDVHLVTLAKAGQ
jgi:hypothetical protein